MVADVAGKPLRSWDSRGQTHRQRFDALQRPTHGYVHKGTSERLLLRTVYGEALDPPGLPPTDAAFASPAQQANLRGRVHQVYDCAGLVTSIEHDFKGNLLSASRRLAVAYQTEPDWVAAENLADPAAILTAVAVLLQSETFTTASTFDALNRVTTSEAPDAGATNGASVTRPVYNEANLLEAVHVSVRGATEAPVITDLDYNARGQRVLCAYANGTTTTYQYDPKTFRLTELLTLRGGAKLQHLLYSYDPVGNITDIQDLSNWDSVLSALTASGVTGSGKYRYDALYRLLSATGREHPGPQPSGDSDTEPPRWGIPHGNDLQALQSYREELSYDEVGNILEMRHLRGNSNNASWSRRYDYFLENNRLRATSAPGDAIGTYSDPYGYKDDALNDAGAHGSMTSMPHLASMEWDYADRLKHTLKSTGSAQDTYFTYDASGQRVRKVYHHNGLIEERIYLGGYEVYRRHTSGSITATPDEERQTLHVMDDQRRVAMVETKTRDAGAAVANPVSRWRFQLDNHLGSATLELDASGSVISYEEFHPYGSTAFHTADGNAEVSAKRYRYTGKEKDDETGLYYHGARYYAPWLGRWTAADPAGLIDGPNRYYYVRDNPIRMNDPSGHQSAAPALDPETVKIARTALERAAQVWGRASVIPGGAPQAAPAAAGMGSAAAAGALLVYAAAFISANVLALHFHAQRSASIAKYGNPYGVPRQDAAFPVLQQIREKQQQIERPFPEPVPPPAPETGAEDDKKEDKPILGRIYVTYTKYNVKTGLTYSGRTSAVINLRLPWRAQAQAAVDARDANHHVDENVEPKDSGFLPAVLDQYAAGLAVDYKDRYRDVGYLAIRGREQQLIDHAGAKRAKHLGITNFQGGARKDTDPGAPLTENKVRGVAKDNPFGEIFHAAANLKFGQIAPFTGHRVITK
jgi:RHS repeat-associated protein